MEGFYETFSDIFMSFPVPNLFDHNLNLVCFDYCFANSMGAYLTTTTLFEHNTEALSFNYTFEGCYNLDKPPLFQKNLKATSFKGTFKNCQWCEMRADIFCTETPTNLQARFAGKDMVFDEFLYLDEFNGNASYPVPQLWNYTCHSETHTNWINISVYPVPEVIDNYADIPTAWGGAG